jgi:hypothetical protein
VAQLSRYGYNFHLFLKPHLPQPRPSTTNDARANLSSGELPSRKTRAPQRNPPIASTNAISRRKSSNHNISVIAQSRQQRHRRAVLLRNSSAQRQQHPSASLPSTNSGVLGLHATHIGTSVSRSRTSFSSNSCSSTLAGLHRGQSTCCARSSPKVRGRSRNHSRASSVK